MSSKPNQPTQRTSPAFVSGWGLSSHTQPVARYQELPSHQPPYPGQAPPFLPQSHTYYPPHYYDPLAAQPLPVQSAPPATRPIESGELGPGQSEETPLIDFAEPPANAREFPAARPRTTRTPLGSTHLIRIVLVGGLAAILILLTLAVLFVMNPEPSGSHRSHSSGTTAKASLSKHEHSITTTLSAPGQDNWHKFYYDFTLGSELGVQVRYPSNGESLSNYVPGLVAGDQLISYDACCRDEQFQAFCLSHMYNSAEPLIDGTLVWNSEQAQFHLKIAPKSEILLSASCRLSVQYSKD